MRLLKVINGMDESKQKLINSFRKFFMESIFLLSSFFAGICLLLLAIILFVNSIFLSPIFQKKALYKSGVYTQFDNIVKENISILSNTIAEENEFRDILNSSYTEMEDTIIRDGVDSLVDGLSEYIKGRTNLLPDIYIGKQNIQAMPAEIDSISLEAILLYYDKSYLIDFIMLLRQVFLLIKFFPLNIFLLIMLFYFIGVITSDEIINMRKWWRNFTIVSVLFYLVAIFGTLLCLKFLIIPSNSFYYLLYLQGGQLSVILGSYLKLFGVYLISLLLLHIIILIVSYIVLPKIYNFIKLSFVNALGSEKAKISLKNNPKHISMIFVTFIIIVFLQNIYRLIGNYELNNPAKAANRIMKYGAMSDVIAAKDDLIYTFELIINDEITGDPIPNIRVLLTEITSNTETALAITDDRGTVNMGLDRGIYRVELFSYEDDLILAQSFLVEINSAGKNSLVLCIEQPNKHN